jgi:hypothetical protein
MDTHDYQFLSEFFPTEIKEERYRVIQDMVKFIVQCVDNRNESSSQLAATHLLQNSVNAMLFRYAEHTPKMFKRRVFDLPATIPLVIEAVRKSMKRAMVSKICQAPFALNGLSEALSNELQAEEMLWEEPKVPSVKEAFTMAKANFVRIETGIVFFVALYEMLRPSPYVDITLDGVDAVRTVLYHRRLEFMVNVLLFGNMLGGEHGKEATKMMMREMVYDPNANINFSVIQFLQPLGFVRSGYLSAYDKAFREDIVKHYERL